MKVIRASASAYVQQKRLCVLGIAESKWGPIPFSHAQPCDAEDGPVDFGKELEEPLKIAMQESEQAIMNKVQRDKLQLASENLVDRARAGDQNAMGTLVMIRKNAQDGQEHAKLAMKYLLKYARNTKVFSPFGFEPLQRTMKAFAEEIAVDSPLHYSTAVLGLSTSLTIDAVGVTLSNGPRLDNSRIRSLCNSFKDDERAQFMDGIVKWKVRTESPSPAHRIGKCIGLARTLQRVRLPHTPISLLSKLAGWELD